MASQLPTAYSLRRLFTGLAIAAFIAWKLMVASAIINEASPPAANNHQPCKAFHFYILIILAA
jgi:hypothetical protein